jgi:hypothetical protein
MIDLRASLLAAGCMIFAVLIAAEFATNMGGERPRPPPPARVERESAAPMASRPDLAGLVATTLARPLLSPTRRAPEVAGADANASDFSNKRLTGIVIAPEHRLAIFAVNGAKPLILDEGDTVDGWRIESIAPMAISLRGPSGMRTLQPKTDPHLIRPPPFAPPTNPDAQAAIHSPQAPAAAARPVATGGFASGAPARPVVGQPNGTARPGQRQ